MPDLFVTVDMGGTQTRAALCDSQGKILKRVQSLTPARQGAEAVVENLRRTIRGVWPIDDEVKALGVAVPGPLDPWKGIILYSPNIPGWDGYPLAETLRRIFDVEVRIDDDANAAALGEHRFGAGKGKSNLVYLTIGTGVGSGFIVDGNLVRGSRGMAGEAGHMILANESPIACGCGRRGCLESLVSGPALAERARLALRADKPSMILVLAGGDLAAIDGKVVGEAANLGDPLARSILAQAGAFLGVGLINLMLIFDPEIIIIGGSVSQAGDFLLEPARKAVRDHRLARLWRETSIVQAKLGDDAGLLGAFCLVSPAG